MTADSSPQQQRANCDRLADQTGQWEARGHRVGLATPATTWDVMSPLSLSLVRALGR